MESCCRVEVPSNEALMPFFINLQSTRRYGTGKGYFFNIWITVYYFFYIWITFIWVLFFFFFFLHRWLMPSISFSFPCYWFRFGRFLYWFGFTGLLCLLFIPYYWFAPMFHFTFSIDDLISSSILAWFFTSWRGSQCYVSTHRKLDTCLTHVFIVLICGIDNLFCLIILSRLHKII